MLPYSSTVADHFNSPRNAGEMESPDSVGRATFGGRAPRVVIYLKVHAGTVRSATFLTFGCGYAIASCSALTEMVKDVSVADCQAICADDLIKALDGLPTHREFCAQVAIDALHDAIAGLPST